MAQLSSEQNRITKITERLLQCLFNSAQVWLGLRIILPLFYKFVDFLVFSKN